MLRLFTAICLLAFASSPAWAACKGKDIRGLYLVYATGVQGNGFFATVCGVRVSSNGSIASGSNCVSDIVNPVRGGRLTVARDCTVTGVINTRDDNIRVPAASMNTHKNTISGVYLVPRGEGSFTAVKHKRITGASPSMSRYFEQ